MTKEEIIEAFNIQYNNVNSNAAPGFDSYEISYYMTKAHREIINSYYNGNAKGDSIDSKEKVRSLLSRYIKTESIIFTETTKESNFLPELTKATLKLNADTWQILAESLILTENKEVLIKPVSYDTLLVISEDPFKKPNLYRAWRLDTQGNNPAVIEEFDQPNINSYFRYIDLLYNERIADSIEKYRYTYLMMPEAIVLDNLEEVYGPGFTIDGISNEQIPKTISRFLWDIIINRAVELAVKDYKENTLQNQIAIAQRTE